MKEKKASPQEQDYRRHKRGLHIGPSRLQAAVRIAIAALPAVSALAQAQSAITDLGTLGGSTSIAKGVSADGLVVVGQSLDPADHVSSEHAFRWTGGTMTDLGTLSGTGYSRAYGVSADGTTTVGLSQIASGEEHAVRWVGGAGITDLGTLGGDSSQAFAVSANGSVIVGNARRSDGLTHAFRWSGGSMSDLGTLGGSFSSGLGVSGDGSVVVGYSSLAGDMIDHAYRWTGGVMSDLGTLGGTRSYAYGVSSTGSVVVGTSYTAGDFSHQAFRWTQEGGMVGLGTLGGSRSAGAAVSGDGLVVVGSARNVDDVDRAFRWTQAGGMQSVEDWLRANGVTVASDITRAATATNSNGSVVVGDLANHHAFIARVAGSGGDGGGSGLVTLDGVSDSLNSTSSGGRSIMNAMSTVVHGAHSRPLARRVDEGRNVAWVAGDWGRDDHGSRNGNLGLAEFGFGHNYGALQLNVSLGHTWARQDLVADGRAKTEGSYALVEALIPVAGKLWRSVGAYGHRGDARLRRGYDNAGTLDASTGTPDVTTWGVRARLDWDQAFTAGNADFSPYADVSYTEAKLEAYTETGGGFPARFDARREQATEMRLGMNAGLPLAGEVRLLGTLEAAHRFEKRGADTSGQMIGLFAFDIQGPSNQRDWLRAGMGLESRLGGGTASLMLNATTKGEAPNYWLAANWQKAF